MLESKTLSTDIYLSLLLIVPAIAMLGLTACSTTSGTTRNYYKGGYADIAPRAYNSQSRSFDRPWPFGPESSQQ